MLKRCALLRFVFRWAMSFTLSPTMGKDVPRAPIKGRRRKHVSMGFPQTSGCSCSSYLEDLQTKSRESGFLQNLLLRVFPSITTVAVSNVDAVEAWF